MLWHKSPFPALCHSYVSVTDWVFCVLPRLSLEDPALFAVLCWQLWCHRNSCVWKQKCWTPNRLLNSSGQILFQWRCASKSLPKPVSTTYFQLSIGGNLVWSKPPAGFCKVNVDGALFGSQYAGSGCVIRDAHGQFLQAFYKRFPGFYTPKEAKLLSI